MKMLMITWTDIFLGLGTFFEWIFKGMRMLGQGPNVVIWLLIIGGITYWTIRLNRYRKASKQNGTIE